MHKIHSKSRKGFTLIELLVVIAIIAVLAVVVILSLNPAELLRQARDSNRISDMATLKSAVSLYLADQSNPDLASSSAGYADVYTSFIPATSSPSAWGYSAAFTTATTTGSPTSTAFRNVDSTGWIPVNFTAISSGAPLGSLPVDPVNNGTLFYGYAATSTTLTFKVTATMESAKYSSGSADVENTDGGISSTTYEQGTNLSL